MKLYFVRHGHMEEARQKTTVPDNGPVDEPLDYQGLLQAEAVSKELKDVDFDYMISSPLKRAHQTAEIINENHNLKIVIENDLRERETGKYVTLEVWNELFNFDSNFLPENTEPLKDFFDRVYTSIDKLKKQYQNKTVLVVSHGGVHQALYAYVNKVELVGNVRNSPLGNCEYRIYEI